MGKIKKTKGISVVLLFIMALQMMMPVNFTYGDIIPEHDTELVDGGSYLFSDTTTSSAINATIKLEFKDKGGNVIDHTKDNVPFDASVKLAIRLDIADMESTNDPDDPNFIDISKVYEIKIAEQINISETKTIPIYHPETDEQIAAAQIDTDGTVTITFLEAINGYDEGRYVWFEADGTIDESKLNEGGEQELIFEFPGKTETVEVKFEEKVEKVTLDKFGSWDKEKNEITWTITAKGETTPSGGTITNIVITDTLGFGQNFLSQDAGGAAYDSEKNTFTIAELKDGETKTIKIVTKPDLSAFDPVKEGQAVVISNEVSGTFGEDNKDTNTKTTTVTSTIDFINKRNGSFKQGATRDKDYIEWTIEINNNNLVMPSGTKLEDFIPTGLELIENTVKIDDKLVNNENFPKVNLTQSTNGFSIIFEEGLTKKTKITYQTSITDPNAYEPDETVSYTNTANLTWSGKSVLGTGTVGIGRTVIEKSGNGYEANDNRYVKWKITVNKDKLDIINPVVTDTLPVELEYVSSAAPAGWTTTATAIDGKATVEFRYVGTLQTTATINIIARVKDAYKEIYGANKSTDFRNKVKLDGDNIELRDKEAVQTYKSTVVAKSNIDYDYTKRVATWKIVVNQNNMTINNTVVTDTIGENHEFVADSLKLGNDPLTQITGTPAVGEYSVVGKVITINLGKLTSTQTLTYETEIPEEKLIEIFGKNSTSGAPKITNSATITGDEIKVGGETVTAEKVIKNTVVSKKAKYTNGNDFIEWSVEINLNQLDFGDAEVTLEDDLQSILILDKNSVKLYKLTMNPNGTYNQVTDIDIVNDKLTVDYDINTNEAMFKLGKLKDAYLLKFITDINSDQLNQTIENSITLKGHDTIGDNSKDSIPVSFNNLDGGGGGSKTKGSIRIIKKDDYGALLKGVEFELIDINKNKFNPEIKGETDENGVIFFNDLQMRTYYLRETEAPEGYLLPEGDEMIVLKKGFIDGIDQKNQEITIVNEKVVKDNIKVKKVDGAGEPLKNAEFELYVKGGNIPIASAFSGEDGFVAFDEITKGEYLIKEKKAPEGYLRSSRVIYVKADKISDDSSKLNITYSYDDDKYNVADPEFINTSIDIELIKKNDRDVLLPGSEFTLYDSEGNQVGDAVVSKAEIAANGNVVFKGIKLGTYTIEETDFPEGYIKTPVKIGVTVSVSEDGTEKTVTFDGYEDNEIPTVANKLDIKDDIIIIKVNTSDSPLKLAEFSLYALIDGEMTDEVGRSLSQEDGTVRFEDIAEGAYAIKEIVSPAGYIKSDEIIYVKVGRTDGNLPKVEYGIDGKNYSSDVPKFLNDSIDIEFKKEDNRNNSLSGAEFTLFNEDMEAIATSTSNSEGNVVFKAVPAGTYTIKETKALSGYKNYDKEIAAVVNEAGEVLFTVDGYESYELTVVNEKKPSGGGSTPVYGKIVVKKINEDREVLSGAEFTLYNANGKVVGKTVTGSDGTVSFEELEPGDYVLKETKAPEGYELSNEIIIVSVEGNRTVEKSFVNKLKDTPVVPAAGNILINKVDENSMALSGAEFTLYNENNQIIGTAVSNESGRVIFENLADGKYFVRETKAPVGYVLSSDILTVNVAEGNTYTYRFKNTPASVLIEDPNVPSGWEAIDDPAVPEDNVPVLPNTGSLLNTWILTIIGLVFILTGIVLYGRREFIG